MSEVWRNATPGAYLTIDRPNGQVTLTVAAPGKVLVRAVGVPETEETVAGHAAAVVRAHELAGEMGD